MIFATIACVGVGCDVERITKSKVRVNEKKKERGRRGSVFTTILLALRCREWGGCKVYARFWYLDDWHENFAWKSRMRRRVDVECAGCSCLRVPARSSNEIAADVYR